jgi:hypothetical protein
MENRTMKGRGISFGGAGKNNGTNAALAGAGLGAVSGASTPILSSCPPDDTSFMCKLSRFYNIVKMLIGLVVIFVLIGLVLWFGINWWRSRRA